MTEASEESGSNAPIEPVIGPLTADERAADQADTYGPSFQIGFRPGGYPVEKILPGKALGRKTPSSGENGTLTGIQPLHDHSAVNAGRPPLGQISEELPDPAKKRHSDAGQRGRTPKRRDIHNSSRG